jgi:hypothetical protein
VIKIWFKKLPVNRKRGKLRGKVHSGSQHIPGIFLPNFLEAMQLSLQLLTLIGPGEVKVDLADFQLKFQENLLGTLYYFFLPIPAESLLDLFELLT